MRNLGVLCLITILFCISFQVVLRYCFNRNTSWAEEVGQLCYIAVCFLGISLIERENGHIRLDLVFSKFPQAEKALRLTGRLLTAVYSGIIAYSEWILRPSVAVVKTKASGIPLRYIHYIIMFGCIVWCIDAILGLIKDISEREEV